MVKRRAERDRAGGGEAAHVKPEREVRLVAALLQPTSQQYNGQGVARPSVCIALHADDFDQQWRELWSQHVNFGTAKSHKKLAKKAEKQAMAKDAAQYSTTREHPVAAIAKKAKGPARHQTNMPMARSAAAVVEDLALAQRKRAILSSKAAMLLAGCAESEPASVVS